jgi:hypothetical protein
MRFELHLHIAIIKQLYVYSQRIMMSTVPAIKFLTIFADGLNIGEEQILWAVKVKTDVSQAYVPLIF